MFKVFKAVANNMSEGTYLKSVNNLEFKENSVDLIDSINPVDVIDKEEVLNELDKLQNVMRHDNLRIFRSNIFSARCEQFLVMTLPAILVAGSIALWVSPANRIKTEELDTYKKIETVICGEHQVKMEDPKLYYSSFFGKNFVDESRATDMLSGTGKRLEIYITENLEGFLAKLDIRSDGSLSISDVDKGSYINLNEYDFTDAVNVEDKYVALFDRTVDLILESSYINDEDKEKLSSLNDSDKKLIIAKIIEYEDLGATNVKVYKSNWFWRIALTVIAGIYLWIVGFVHKEDGLPEFYELSNNNGELVESEHKKNLGLFYLGVKYKEAFLAAERDRVQRIYDLCDENLVSSSRDKVLTSYEKKLIKK